MVLLDGKYIDERRYARAYVNDKVRFSHWGRIKIRAMLRMQHISDADINEALEDIDIQQYMEVLADVIAAKRRSIDDDGSYALSRKLPTVAELYHNENYEMQYKVSTSFAQMKSAFLTEGGVNSLINRIKGTLNSSAQYDLFLECLRLLATAFNHGAYTYRVGFGYETSAQIQTLLRDIKNTVKDFTFMNNRYNYFGFNTKTKESDIVIITKPDVVSHIDVDYLAGVFNMSKAEIKDRIIYIPDGYGFDGYFDSIDNLGNITPFMIIMDKRMLRIFPTLMEGGSMYNPASLVDNTFLTLMYIFSYSLFMNAIVYCSIDYSTNDNSKNKKLLLGDTKAADFGFMFDPDIVVRTSSNLVYNETLETYVDKDMDMTSELTMLLSLLNADGKVYSITIKPSSAGVISGIVYNGDGSYEELSIPVYVNEEYTFTMKYRAIYPDFENKIFEYNIPRISFVSA